MTYTITLSVSGDDFTIRDCAERLANELRGREVTVHSCEVQESAEPSVAKKGKRG